MVDFPTALRAPGPLRRTRHIGRKPASNLWHAFNVARQIGRPFTHFVTVNFHHTNCIPEVVSSQFRRALDAFFGPWWRRPPKQQQSGKPGPYAFAWVVENTSGHPAVHWAVHLPRQRLADFMTRLPRWIATVADGITSPEAIDVRPIRNPGVRRYMLKGADPAYAAFCKIDPVPQGEVIGKRSGFSRSVGPAARRRLRES